MTTLITAAKETISLHKTCIFANLLLTTYTHGISLKVGGSKIEVAHFLAGSHLLMRPLNYLLPG